MERPIIGITVDNRQNTARSGVYELSIDYARAVVEAGGVPLLLPHEVGLANAYVHRCDGLVLSGGVDPCMEGFGVATHSQARPMDPVRQGFELALLAALHTAPSKCVLGICLGMQLMALAAGGRLDQFLPEHLSTAEAHNNHRLHSITLLVEDSVLNYQGQSPGQVISNHQQAVSDPGRLRSIAVADDGTVEAIDDRQRPFYLGVQWHPERGGDGPLSRGLFHHLVQAAAAAT